MARTAITNARWLNVSGTAPPRSAPWRGIPIASTVVTVFAVCFALIKVRIIMREFMEVRNAPKVLRRLTDFWVLLMAAALLGVYFGGTAVA